MTADDFKAWIQHMGYNTISATAALGISRNSVAKYIAEGAPKSIALACAALAFGLPPWSKG